MRRFIIAAFLAAGVLGLATPAHATTTVKWVPREHYPCKYGAEWSLLPVEGITSATLNVDGTTYPMDVRQHWSYTVHGPITSWYAMSVGPIDGDSDVTAIYEGNAEGSLDIAACVETPPTTPPPTSPPPTTTPPPSTSTTPPPPTTTPPTPCDHPPCGRRTADTGSSSTPLAVGGLLLASGLGASIVARKRTGTEG